MVAIPWAAIHEDGTGPMAHLRVLGIAMVRQTFHIVDLDDAGHIVLRKRIPWGALKLFLVQVPPIVLGIEA